MRLMAKQGWRSPRLARASHTWVQRQLRLQTWVLTAARCAVRSGGKLFPSSREPGTSAGPRHLASGTHPPLCTTVWPVEVVMVSLTQTRRAGRGRLACRKVGRESPGVGGPPSGASCRGSRDLGLTPNLSERGTRLGHLCGCGGKGSPGEGPQLQVGTGQEQSHSQSLMTGGEGVPVPEGGR